MAQEFKKSGEKGLVHLYFERFLGLDDIATFDFLTCQSESLHVTISCDIGNSYITLTLAPSLVPRPHPKKREKGLVTSGAKPGSSIMQPIELWNSGMQLSSPQVCGCVYPTLHSQLCSAME